MSVISKFEEFEEEIDYSDSSEGQVSLVDEVIAGSYSASMFASEIKQLAEYYVDAFFSAHYFHSGGRVPAGMLHDPLRISRLFSVTITEAVDIIYNVTSQKLTEEEIEAAKRGRTTWDIELVSESLKLLAISGVPQEWAGGMLLMYVELCKGIKIE